VSLDAHGGKPQAVPPDVNEAVSQYFHRRYQVLAELYPDDLAEFWDDRSPEARACRRRQADCLGLLVDAWRQRGLRYERFSYALSFLDVELNGEVAELTIGETHEVQFPGGRAPARAGGIRNYLRLRAGRQRWRVERHDSNDDLYRSVRRSGLSPEAYRDWLATGPPPGLEDDNPLPRRLHHGGGGYSRGAAVAYAHQWALSRNLNDEHHYADFEGRGGDCANFASQVLHAGGCEMDSSGGTQWFWYGGGRFTSSWTGVDELYAYLMNNTGVGPQAVRVGLSQVDPGDIIQLDLTTHPGFEHTLVVVEAGDPPALDNILISCHTIDRDNYPLSSYVVRGMRQMKISG